VSPAATRVDLDRKRVSTPLGEFPLSKIEENTIFIAGEQNGLIVFGSLDRLSGKMSISWQHPTEAAKLRAGQSSQLLRQADLNCSLAKRLF
jgi:hypothetical protein